MTSVVKSFRLNTNNDDDRQVLQLIEEMENGGSKVRDLVVPAILHYRSIATSQPPIKSTDKALAILQVQLGRLMSMVTDLKQNGGSQYVVDQIGGEVDEIATRAAVLMNSSSFEDEE